MTGPVSAGDPVYREATIADARSIMHARAADPEWGPADPRTGLYLEGTHHPQMALPPRVAFVAVQGESIIGYIAGHLTRRYDCDGEVQYLWVAVDHRGSGVATRLLHLQAGWFVENGAHRVCVDVLPDNGRARSFYSRHGAEELNPHWLIWSDIASSLKET